LLPVIVYPGEPRSIHGVRCSRHPEELTANSGTVCGSGRAEFLIKS